MLRLCATFQRGRQLGSIRFLVRPDAGEGGVEGFGQRRVNWVGLDLMRGQERVVAVGGWGVEPAREEDANWGTLPKGRVEDLVGKVHGEEIIEADGDEV